MPVKSLMDLATAACIKNIRELESVGDYLPYENVRNILIRVDNAPQLRQIEINSPQIEGETGEIWLKLIEREFPMEYKARAYKPQNPKKWYRVWERYKKDHDQALQESEKKLMNALAGLRQDKEKNTSRIVDRKLLPRAGRVGPKRGWGQRDTAGSTLSFARGSRTKTANGASVMRKVRREVKEIASIHGALSRPTRGPSALTQMKKAPPAMVNDYRRAAQPVFRATPRILEPPAAVTEYEERATFLSDSEDDDDNDNDDNDDWQQQDELFDDQPSAPPPRSHARASATSLLKKRPAALTGSSTPRAVTSRPVGSSSKRPGLLSNSYKPAASRSDTPSSVSTSTYASPSKAPQSFDSPRASQGLPRTQSSPPPASSTSTPASPPVDVQPRKRKAASIFMSRKRRV